MRIAMLSVHSCPVGNLGARDTGGMSVYIRELAAALGRQGHTVDVYTRVHDPADPQVIPLGENASLVHIRAGEEEKIHKLAVYSYLPDFACRLENYRKSNDLEYDLVFSHYWLSGWVGSYLQQWWHVPHVIMFHTLGAVKNSLGIGEDEPELRLVTEREAAQQCHGIIAATEREKEELVSSYGAGPSRISVIPCGVNLEMFRPLPPAAARRELGLGAGEKVILYVGRMERLKGLGRLLRALPHLRHIPGLRLVAIGGDEDSRREMERFQNLAAGLGVADAVTFAGRKKHGHLPAYYSAADVCVIPSYYESFGLVALEALACGTPVVAADVGDMKNIITPGETGYVADNTPESLAEKIAAVLSRRESLPPPASIRASVSQYGWPNIAAEVARELCRVVARQPSAIA